MQRTHPFTTSRRSFLKTAGCLTIGFPLLGGCTTMASEEKRVADQQLPGSLRNHPAINAWLEVNGDGTVRILTGKMELGQGLMTAIMQVAAEELNMDIAKVDIVMAETGRTPDEGATTGSRSIEISAMSVRYAAAAAREKLIELAARQLQVSAEQLELQNGLIKGPAEKQIMIPELLKGKQIEDSVKLPVKLKRKADHQLVGKAIPRRDVEDMVRAREVFIHNLRFPDMVHARVVRPTSYHAKLQSSQAEMIFNEATSLSGVLKVVRSGDFIGVIAAEEYEAVKVQRFLLKKLVWEDSKEMGASTQTLKAHIKGLPSDDGVDENTGNAQTAIADASKKHAASYSKPYIMHGANGPSCAVAIYQENKLDIWSHSQGVYPLREAIAALVGVPEDHIHIKGVPGAGCYGHNAADDVAAEAALLAKAYPGKHVRLQWMREEEHAWEPYGSAMVMELEAGLDDRGTIAGWRYELWSDSHSSRPGGRAQNLLPARYMEDAMAPPSGGFRGGALRNSEPYYTVPALQINSHIFKGPLRVSALRGLGAYANIFAIESFMDELAEEAGIDPWEFRIRHLTDERSLACLNELEKMVGSGTTRPNEGIGIAFSRYKNTAAYCAVAALVQVDSSSGNLQVKKMWATVDAGEVINPDGLKNQIEGGMVQSASWTIKEQVVFDEETISSRDWASYPIFRFRDVPEVEVLVIDRPNDPPLGAGEASQGPASAAIANAVYTASGKRVRDLPISKEKLMG